MAYRRPGIEIIQQFQAAAPALALPTLPALVIGPGYQVIEDGNAGNYDDDEGTLVLPVDFAYPGLAPGSVVDLADLDPDELASIQKPVSVTLEDAYLVEVSGSAANTIGLVTPTTIFTDPTPPNVFAAINPGAVGAPSFYLQIVSGTGLVAADFALNLIVAKTNDNQLKLARAITGGATAIVYRVLSFNASIEIDGGEFDDLGIVKTATEVTLPANLLDTVGGKKVAIAEVHLGWRAVRPDLKGVLNAFTDLASLEALFGVGQVVPANLLAYGVLSALDNTTTEVLATGLDATLFTDEALAYTEALDFVADKDVYGIAVMSQEPLVHQLLAAHVTQNSASTVGRERYGVINRKLKTFTVIVPTSGTGFSSPGATSPPGNKTFKDLTETFITDGVGVGMFLEIDAYVATAALNRLVATVGGEAFSAQITSGWNFNNPAGPPLDLVGDVGRILRVSGTQHAQNNVDHIITVVVSAITPIIVETDNLLSTPTSEVTLPASTAVEVILDIPHSNPDGVTVAGPTAVWTFASGGPALTANDVGRKLRIANAANAGNNGDHIITAVPGLTGPYVIHTSSVGITTELFATAPALLASVVKTIVHDPSDTLTAGKYVWLFPGEVFTPADIGRQLFITGTATAADGTWVIYNLTDGPGGPRIETVTGPPGGPFALPFIAAYQILEPPLTAAQAEFIENTRHFIASIDSETQLTLQNDPTAGFLGALSAITYQITRNLTRNEEASFLAGYSSSFANRRLSNVWPDILLKPIGGVETEIPGFFGGAALVGFIAGLPSQQPFTNLTLTGFTGRVNGKDRFSDVQLDTIAGGGTLILEQDVEDTPLFIRHQLTTDLSTLFFQELSVTKNVDAITRFLRGIMEPYIGPWNVTEALIDHLKTVSTAGIEFLKNSKVDRAGAVLIDGTIVILEPDPLQGDTVNETIDITVPLPFNNLRITLLI
jgi:hypothetical protein